MNDDALIDHLEYRGAPGFLDESRWHEAIELAHVLRRTAAACAGPEVRGRFRGIYTLSTRRAGARHATTPVVCVAQAPDARAADRIHHIIWNQSVVPFLIVHTPRGVRLYTGFDYGPSSSGDADDGDVPTSQRGILDGAITFEEVATRLDAFRARHIDDGGLWATWGDRIDPARRVDVRLLGELARLGDWLREEAQLAPAIAHALIGRFVYLRYLRERGILTDSLVRSWDVDPATDFGRSIRYKSFRTLLSQVDQRLNGSIFPLPLSGDGAPSLKHIQTVAGVMLGDEVQTGQLHLDFRPYDFSYIPIETLSAIYEQFMATEGRDRDAGAFYTPIPLVNFVLAELDDLRPLGAGMRVLDPACGSGAFLVQCYQLLCERRRRETGADPAPRELREILVTQIFGMDRDEDACRVTEFSLALALLDQIPAETLARLHNFKLPELHGNNIVHGDFFAMDPPAAAGGFDWIVGNPPWVSASAAKVEHQPALRWMKENRRQCPVSGNQMAEAFAWRAPIYLHGDGIVAFVLPATTFFKEQRSFRERFFSLVDVKAVANLTNLRRVLFDGRAETPAFVILYSSPREDPASVQDIAAYSPLVVNQEAVRPAREGERRAAWAITIDYDEVRFVPKGEVADGDPLPWKLAMWGGPRDLKMLRRVAGRFSSLVSVVEARRWSLSQGLDLRDIVEEKRKPLDKREALIPLSEARGEFELRIKSLRDALHVHSFPRDSFQIVTDERAHARRRGGLAGLAVWKPPHVIVHAARSFAVFSEDFIVVPPPQIGIAGARGDEALLRALALYLGSDFVWYHQFLTSPEMEYRGRSTIEALKRLPVPLLELEPRQLAEQVELHRQLIALSDRRWALASHDALRSEAAIEDLHRQMAALEDTANQLTARVLGLTRQEQWLVDDLVHVRRHLTDGKIGDAAAGRPTELQLTVYAETLRDELDVWLDRGHRFRHAVTVVHEPRAGMVQIAFSPSSVPHEPRVEPADSTVGRRLRAMRDRIDREHSQWLYFDRNLVIHHEDKVYLCKPMQRFWWTRSQALADADRIIADLVAAGGRS